MTQRCAAVLAGLLAATVLAGCTTTTIAGRSEPVEPAVVPVQTTEAVPTPTPSPSNSPSPPRPSRPPPSRPASSSPPRRQPPPQQPPQQPPPPPTRPPRTAPPTRPPAPPSRPPHVLVFEITGNATLQVSYVVDGRSTGVTPRLPWRRSISLPAGSAHEWGLTIDQIGGELAVLVTLDGGTVGRGSGSGGGQLRFGGSIPA